jgi:hypothetical protein
MMPLPCPGTGLQKHVYAVANLTYLSGRPGRRYLSDGGVRMFVGRQLLIRPWALPERAQTESVTRACQASTWRTQEICDQQSPTLL